MQPHEYTAFKKYVEATSRPDVWAKRMRLAPELIELRHDSINSLVGAIDGNTRDRVWLSSALSAGAVERDEMGRLRLPPAAPSSGEAEEGTLDWLLDKVWACDEHVSISYMLQAIENAWHRAADARAAGKHWKHNETNDSWAWADKEDE